ncbi:unnamed protein product [Rotaria sp. Silwood2]|nr:unnamed protein product [Rotaria sp. Silwood2]CAF3359640.1 unnamed protein product [Rotaria sp. Silwood2]CAF4255604.1 unnamed protein product [Rotaria sp. Silwood2]
MTLVFIVFLLLVLVSHSQQASCPIGKYLYQGQCILCTPGYYCPDGESQIICSSGQVAPGYGFRSCQQCSAGWYSTCSAQETCIICPKGFYCPTNSQEPQPCPVGFYSHYGAISCTQCPAGYYTTYTNSSYCFQCPMGYMCSDPTQCPQPCPAGSYQPNIMSTSCAACPAEHQCGTTTNLLQCTTTTCIQAQTWSCDPNQQSPPPYVCTNIG